MGNPDSIPIPPMTQICSCIWVPYAKILGSTLKPNVRYLPGAAHMPEESQKALTFEIERDGDTAIVKCHGRLVLGTSEELYQAVKYLLPQTKVVVVDLADLTYVDSMGLGTLVRLYASSRQEGCEFKLLHLGKQLRNVLKMTNLLSVFSQAEDHGVNIA
jgi:anti-sigma B factor antagonist